MFIEKKKKEKENEVALSLTANERDRFFCYVFNEFFMLILHPYNWKIFNILTYKSNQKRIYIFFIVHFLFMHRFY